jgi:glucose-1-phosphatase
MAAIKNIIFDLGGVLLNINYEKTSQSFKNIGLKNFDELYSQYKANPLFENLETGKISEEGFYAAIQQYANHALLPEQIKTAWNALLLDWRLSSLSFLETISKKYKLFLLSNTNIIHYKAFNDILYKETGKTSLDGYFLKSYYSHLIQMRKPYKQTYKVVVSDCNIIPGETLFIDDSITNIGPAKEFGLLTHHLLPHERIEDLGL